MITYWTLAFNIFCLIAMSCALHENGMPTEGMGLAMAFLYLVTPAITLVYIVSNPKKKDPPKVGGTFVPGHDIKEVHTVRRCD